METTEDQIIEKIDGKCMRCTGHNLIPFEYEWTRISCGHNVFKRNIELGKKSGKIISFD